MLECIISLSLHPFPFCETAIHFSVCDPDLNVDGIGVNGGLEISN